MNEASSNYLVESIHFRKTIIPKKDEQYGITVDKKKENKNSTMKTIMRYLTSEMNL